MLSGFLKDLMNEEISEKEKESEQRSRINGYKMRFKEKQIDELERIANDDKLVPEAIKAVQELILIKMENWI